MTTQKPHVRSTRSNASTKPTRIWVCAHECRYGTRIWACSNEKAAYASLARVCRENWRAALQVDQLLASQQARQSLPADPPKSDRRTVELYFSMMREDDPTESYVVDEQELVE